MLELSKLLNNSKEFIKLLEDLELGKSKLFAYGVSDSQRAFLISALKERVASQVLIITADSLEAKKIADDLSFFLGSDMVVLYPPSSILPYEVAAKSLEVTAQRLKVLEMLLAKKPVVVVAPIKALLTKVLPRDVMEKFKLCFKVGEVVPLEGAISKLSMMGYERVDMIEGKGQFAVRGGILDIYPLTCDAAYRVEFFDDEVDSIRDFMPDDQRSINKLENISIGPAREVVYDEMTAKRGTVSIANELKEREEVLKSLGQEEKAENLSEKIQEHIANFKNGLLFETAQLYISHLYPKLSTIMDYFKRQYMAILIEPDRIIETQKNVAFEAEETFKELFARGEILSSQANIYCSPFEVLEGLENQRTVYMSMLPKIHPKFEPNAMYSFQFRSTTPLYGKVDLLIEEITSLKNKGFSIVLLSGTIKRGKNLVKELIDNKILASFTEDKLELTPGQVVVMPGFIERGFEIPDLKLCIISDSEIFGKKSRKRIRRPKTVRKGKKITSFQELDEGDYIVHITHGIGKYLGVESLEVGEHIKDYFSLAYAGGDKLYVPTNQVDLIQKYVGAGKPPKLSKLGGTEWTKAKNKVKKSVKEMAENLIKLYAARETSKGFAFSKDTPWQKEFEDMFPYEETPDQITAIQEVKKDMEGSKPMDRLLCGDVGYGKTEVAMRAVFKAVMDSKQVAVLVPTTILAEQHYHTFSERFEPFPINIDVLSRFRSAAEQREIIKKLKTGQIDIVIGTHRLLQKDIKFKDLGLLIVDEEQRFGVSHKEKIKQLKKNVDVLTLTATPIPRTMHMALSGVRDMSIIETPPDNRFPVQTYVVEHNESLIRDAILREMSRQGQVYYVHNRVETIYEEAKKLKDLIPEVKIGIAHGQMAEEQLEDVMFKFSDHEFDVLVCTTIIETGLDIPNVNTLIITLADRMGLSQLYQLRGRVGRANRQAFAYLMYKKDKVLSEQAAKRLSAIREFTEFGAGFKIAMRDLEIRGAGNLLGAEQHGHMATVGYDLYSRLLSAAVKDIKGEKQEEKVQPVIELDINAYISDKYITSNTQKMEIYRRIAAVDSAEDADDLEEEVEDRFGDMPEATRNLIRISKLKALAKEIGIATIVQQQDVVNFKPQNENTITAEMIIRVEAIFQNKVKVLGTKTPTLVLKVRRLKGFKLLLRLEKFLVEMRGIQKTSSVV